MDAKQEAYWRRLIDYVYTGANLHHDEETDRTRMQEWCRREGVETYFQANRDRRAGKVVGSPSQHLQTARWSWYEGYRNRKDLAFAWSKGWTTAAGLVEYLRQSGILPPFD